jgi:hypothetical protein
MFGPLLGLFGPLFGWFRLVYLPVNSLSMPFRSWHLSHFRCLTSTTIGISSTDIMLTISSFLCGKFRSVPLNCDCSLSLFFARPSTAIIPQFYWTTIKICINPKEVMIDQLVPQQRRQPRLCTPTLRKFTQWYGVNNFYIDHLPRMKHPLIITIYRCLRIHCFRLYSYICGSNIDRLQSFLSHLKMHGGL